MPPSLQVPGFGTATKQASTEVEQPSVQLTMQRYIAFAIKEISQSLLSFSFNLGLACSWKASLLDSSVLYASGILCTSS